MSSTAHSVQRELDVASDTHEPQLKLVQSPAVVPVAPTAAARPAPSRWRGRVQATASVVIPPVITLAILIGVWQLACSAPGSSLPTPTAVVAETWELIAHPWYDNGGIVF